VAYSCKICRDPFLESDDTVFEHIIEIRHIYHYFMHHAPHKDFPPVQSLWVQDILLCMFEFCSMRKLQKNTISFYCYAVFTCSSSTKCPMLIYLISYNMQFHTIYSHLTKCQKSTTKGFHFTAFLIYFIQQATCFISTRSL
jgi:hypothetical protein